MNNQSKGFAMLFAVLVSSVLLSIGLSIFNLTLKEIELSSSGRESQFAFYAADTGIECALYWDFNGANIFATSSSSRTPSPSNPDCVAGASPQYITIDPMTVTPSSAATRFSLEIPNIAVAGNSSPYCAVVTVTKTDVNGLIGTAIDSRGYNTCDDTDPTRVERALKVTY